MTLIWSRSSAENVEMGTGHFALGAVTQYDIFIELHRVFAELGVQQAPGFDVGLCSEFVFVLHAQVVQSQRLAQEPCAVRADRDDPASEKVGYRLGR